MEYGNALRGEVGNRANGYLIVLEAFHEPLFVPRQAQVVAKDEDRTLAAMTRRLVVEAVRERGLLPDKESR